MIYDFSVTLDAGETSVLTVGTHQTFFLYSSPVPLLVEGETLEGAKPFRMIMRESDGYELPEGEDGLTLRITNTSPSRASFVIKIGKGRFYTNQTAGDVRTRPTAASAAKGLAQMQLVAGANAIAGNANRRQLVVRSAVGSTGVVWLGGTGVGVGIPLSAGDVAEMDVNGEIAVYSVGNNILNLVEILE